ncbi:MAG: hypothetical protein P0S96_03655 [Simkaniaceae bacterium]|nr:hypothetical protein [Candidatus Sacchlamyda saccharinae]
MTQNAPVTYAQSAYAQARAFEYPNDATFAETAATFGARTVLKTTAVALAVFQTAWYAVMSAATFPVSFINTKAYDHFSSRMNTSAQVVADVTRSAVWGDSKSNRPNPNAKPLNQTKVQKLKTSGQALVAAAKTRVSNAASSVSATASNAKQRVAGAASSATAFASAHRREILFATVAVATVAAAVAAYHFDVFATVAAQAPAANTSAVPANVTAAPANVTTAPLAPLVVNSTLSKSGSVSVIPPLTNETALAVHKPQEGYSNNDLLAIGAFSTYVTATAGTGTVVGFGLGGPLGAVVGAIAGPIAPPVAWILGTLADQN